MPIEARMTMKASGGSKPRFFSSGNLLIGLLAFTLCSGVAFAQITVIPSASTTGVVVGSGYIKSENRQLMRTAANLVYIAAVDDSGCLQTGSPTQAVLRMYKGSGAQGLSPSVPTSFSEVDSAHHPTAISTGSCQYTGSMTSIIFSPDCRMDASGLIHCVYIAPQSTSSGNVYYQTFNPTTDTWGARTTLATDGNVCGGGAWPRWSNVALTLDSSDHPYVIYSTSGNCAGSFTNQINWVAMTASGGTAWTTATVIPGSSGTQELYPAAVTALDGSIHLTWVESSLQANANIKWAKFSASWGTVETVAAGVLSATDDDGTANIAVDLNGLPHVTYLVGTSQTSPCSSGCNNWERERYRTASGVWTDNSPPSSSGGVPSASGAWPTGGVGHSPSIYISSLGLLFDFLGHDSNKSPGPFETQSALGGNWTAQTIIDPCNVTTSPKGEPGCDGAITIRYDPLRDNNKSLVDLAYYKEDDGTAGYNHHGTIWYKALQIPAGSSISPPTNLSAVVAP